ncbi:archease [Amycolatopsis sp. NPDC005232]|uniref:archease n=1 Tax=unclassified Amycolatopsis TaxID=2618356 RepID=UPI001C69E737|nr:archease [Amycolatopsis sp. DSM 110486]QYN20438.1 archease [Amycolatopsis sp. DSM 110486]
MGRFERKPLPKQDARGTSRVVHAADLRIEAWGPTREACLTEAVRALVESFARTRLHRGSAAWSFEVCGPTDGSVLVALLDKVILMMRTRSLIPVTAEGIVVDGSTVRLRCQMTDLGAVIPTGAIPKAVSRREVRCERTERGWWCAARIDV